MLLDCDSNDDIATRLNVSRATVKFHVRNIFSKLGVTSRLETLRCGAHGLHAHVVTALLAAVDAIGGTPDGVVGVVSVGEEASGGAPPGACALAFATDGEVEVAVVTGLRQARVGNTNSTHANARILLFSAPFLSSLERKSL
jgi:hypothetical protein